MALRERVKVYVVRRLGWEYGDDFYYRDETADAPLRSFLSRDKAEGHRRDLEWAYVRERGVNPFGWIDGSLAERTTLPLRELFDRLRDVGFTLNAVDGEWTDFWSQYDALPDEGKRRTWDVIDRIRFFELVEMEVDLDG